MRSRAAATRDGGGTRLNKLTVRPIPSARKSAYSGRSTHHTTPRRRTMLKGQLRLGICAAALMLLGCSESSDVKATNEAPNATATADAKPGPDGWSGTVRGTVTNLNGDPIEGAYVKLRNEERRLTIMVVSKDAG